MEKKPAPLNLNPNWVILKTEWLVWRGPLMATGFQVRPRCAWAAYGGENFAKEPNQENPCPPLTAGLGDPCLFLPQRFGNSGKIPQTSQIFSNGQSWGRQKARAFYLVHEAQVGCPCKDEGNKHYLQPSHHQTGRLSRTKMVGLSSLSPPGD